MVHPRHRPVDPAIVLSAALCGVFGCGQHLTIAEEEPRRSTEPKEPKEPFSDAGGAPDDGSEGQTPAAPGVPRCSAETPFGPAVKIALAEPLPKLHAFRMSATGIGVISGEYGDDLGMRFVAFADDTLTHRGDAYPGSEVESEAHEEHAMLSADALVMVFGRGPELWLTRRDDAALSFGAPRKIGHSLDGRLWEPYLVGTRLYFARETGAVSTLWTGTLNLVDGTLSETSELSTLAGRNGYPVVSTDELEMFFASRESGRTSIFHATRASRDEPFDSAKPLPTPANGSDEHPTWLSYDACELWVVSHREGEPGLYRQRRM